MRESDLTSEKAVLESIPNANLTNGFAYRNGREQVIVPNIIQSN